MSETTYVKQCAYGKTLVRFMKKDICPKTKTHTVYEMDVQSLLTGELEESYTKADNSIVVPTDTQKNTIYVFAKNNDVSVPEVFAAKLAKHFVDKYKHIHGAALDITITPWTRMEVQGKPHSHSFIRNPGETRKTHVVFSEGKGFDVVSSLKDVLVLKSTGSGFTNFHKCEFTTLPEVTDRIFSTSIDCNYTFKHFDTFEELAGFDFNSIYEKVKEITLETFALDDSESVQATMYKMADTIINTYPAINEVYYALPNKHYFEINLAPFNIDNLGSNCSLYQPQAYPSGYITCTVARK
ncbi:Uricase [Schizosaccharomyces pombe]|uniref:Uricase n=1 Tax=Schizosaccharomyces pombe (strain 972 / ATCC 24843) TaxID=284812 RepID=URIC_SCHPO|nr:putative uricase [Schizosaccharomyces pombe]O74409.1 RecName: Full=Uricase; AltName: Full=Urate oxidase [Schizosaccharomyces pombe 972h-]CAA20878.1 uricase (predicted) [Schizosaccharomyces pombe]|eukprot:NP_588354.1 putative uricase [Schizosaccharomyces pombe]